MSHPAFTVTDGAHGYRRTITLAPGLPDGLHISIVAERGVEGEELYDRQAAGLRLPGYSDSGMATAFRRAVEMLVPDPEAEEAGEAARDLAERAAVATFLRFPRPGKITVEDDVRPWVRAWLAEELAARGSGLRVQPGQVEVVAVRRRTPEETEAYVSGLRAARGFVDAVDDGETLAKLDAAIALCEAVLRGDA